MKITLDFENKEVTVLTKCTVEELKQTLKSLKLDPVWWKINPQSYDNFTFPYYPVYPTYPNYEVTNSIGTFTITHPVATGCLTGEGIITSATSDLSGTVIL